MSTTSVNVLPSALNNATDIRLHHQVEGARRDTRLPPFYGVPCGVADSPARSEDEWVKGRPSVSLRRQPSHLVLMFSIHDGVQLLFNELFRR